MSEEWKVHLVYSDGRSDKFWRARTEGSTMYTSYGRIGTKGQTSIKEFGSASEAEAALHKQADGKRRKGYDDAAPAAPTEPPPAAEAAPGPRAIELRTSGGGRQVEVRLSVDGAAVRTEVSETFASPEDAAAAFARIEQAMLEEGYQRK
ncbi:WGR domain-containing protein [Haliangium sp.]|uniref:WGR domain-containing protein n=1 Tax=Haliangium sp. TaxID=2663208 RepID=UPI003D125A7C